MKINTEVANTVTFSKASLNDIEGYEPTVGWFKNKHNPAGWSITGLDGGEVQWLEDEGFLFDDICKMKRVISDNGHTSLCTFDLVKGTYAFVDNVALNETGDIKFEKKTKFTMLKVENSEWSKYKFRVKC
jgi:hypothetical protein|tara:strand:+ start:206 stop:595 length:390 start_codon:yes stop_codon:yes gene_type:complete